MRSAKSTLRIKERSVRSRIGQHAVPNHAFGGRSSVWDGGEDSDDLGCQTCNLAPSCRTQLVGDNAVDSGS